VVVNPETLLAEIDMLRSHGVRVDESRLMLSHTAHLITPAHRALDRAQEAVARQRLDWHHRPRNRPGLHRESCPHRPAHDRHAG
jgi:hypothetical protein